MAVLKSKFEELADELSRTADRAKQDELLDHWLDLMSSQIDIAQEFSRWYTDEEMLRPRERAALYPRITRRKRLID